MKKFVVLLIVVVMSFTLVACNNTSQEPITPSHLSGFNFVYNEDDDTIWLGMSQTEVEQFGTFVISTRDDGRLMLSGEGLHITLDDDTNIYSIMSSPVSNYWFIPGGITVGTDAQVAERVFDMDYVDSTETSIRAWFAYDHTPISRMEENRAYAVVIIISDSAISSFLLTR